MRAWCSANTPAGSLVSCQRTPPCAINEAHRSVVNQRDCAARKRYSEWPMYDPYLAHQREEDARTVELVVRLGNRTMLIAGDSVSNLDYRGLRCAVQREELFDPVRTARLLESWRAWGRAHKLSCCGQVMSTTLGGTVVFVGVYRYEHDVVAALLRSSDVLLLNYGLHYRHSNMGTYVADMRALFAHIQRANAQAGAGAQGGGTRVLFRETTAQHFKGTGAYTVGAERVGSNGCVCSAHTQAVSFENHIAVENGFVAQLAANVTAGAVPVVPFYALTVPRYNMHNADDWCGHGASRQQALKAGGAARLMRARASSCCDCTHFCFTPQLYDAYFAGVERALALADRRASASVRPVRQLALALRRRLSVLDAGAVRRRG